MKALLGASAQCSDLALEWLRRCFEKIILSTSGSLIALLAGKFNARFRTYDPWNGFVYRGVMGDGGPGGRPVHSVTGKSPAG